MYPDLIPLWHKKPIADFDSHAHHLANALKTLKEAEATGSSQELFRSKIELYMAVTRVVNELEAGARLAGVGRLTPQTTPGVVRALLHAAFTIEEEAEGRSEIERMVADALSAVRDLLRGKAVETGGSEGDTPERDRSRVRDDDQR